MVLLGLCLLFGFFPVAASLPPVYWFAPFYSGGGYCSEAIGFLQALTLQNVSVLIEHHGDSINYAFLQGLPLEIKQLMQHAAQTRPPIKESIIVCHSEPGAWYPPRYHTSRCPPSDALYRIGRTMFETDRLPSGWAERMSEDKMDEIWVPTAFHKQIFVDGGVDAERLQVVGEPIDTDFFSPRNPALQAFLSSSSSSPRSPLLPFVTPSSFLYLSVFKFEERKGYDVLLRAYFEAFERGEDDVALLLLTNAYHGSEDFESPVRDIARKFFPDKLYPQDLPPVHIMSGVDALHLVALYQAADVFVLPSRGEGWGRPHVEAMAMEIPIIATNWSGPSEYMTSTNSYPLRTDGLVEIQDGPFKGHKWAEPSISHLVSLLRYTLTHQEEGRERGREARRDMQARYSLGAMGKELRRHLDRIEKRVEGREGRRAEKGKTKGGGEEL
ncbi:cazy family gt4 [Nannochloropsis oceanica]